MRLALLRFAQRLLFWLARGLPEPELDRLGRDGQRHALRLAAHPLQRRTRERFRGGLVLDPRLFASAPAERSLEPQELAAPLPSTICQQCGLPLEERRCSYVHAAFRGNAFLLVLPNRELH